jgi:uroporphyrinogen-III synthase
VARPKQVIPKTDWIFFSSPRGVHHFFEHYQPYAHCKIAALSIGTAKQLKTIGINPDFTGSEKRSPEEVGEVFRQQIQSDDQILFPISQRSKKTVIQTLPAAQVQSIVIYDTLFEENVQLNHHPDLILFTSPSNFEGYVRSMGIVANTHWVAFGKTTAKAIESFHTTKGFDTLTESTITAFINYLENLDDEPS